MHVKYKAIALPDTGTVLDGAGPWALVRIRRTIRCHPRVLGESRQQPGRQRRPVVASAHIMERELEAGGGNGLGRRGEMYRQAYPADGHPTVNAVSNMSASLQKLCVARRKTITGFMQAVYPTETLTVAAKSLNTSY